MKKVVVICLSVFVFNTNAENSSNKNWILSAQEIKALDSESQRNYLREFKKIISHAANESDYFASLFSPTRSPANENKTYSEEQINALLLAAKKWRQVPQQNRDYNKEKHFQQHLNSMYLVMASHVAIENVDPGMDNAQKELLKEEITDLTDYFKENESTIVNMKGLSEEDKKTFEKAYKDLASAEKKEFRSLKFEGKLMSPSTGKPLQTVTSAPTSPKKTPPPASEKTEPPKETPVAKVKVTEPTTSPAKVVVTDAEEKQKIKVTDPNAEAPKVQVTEAPSDKPESATEEKEKPKEEKFFRCLYAGFIIKQDPCRGPQKLEKENPLSEILNHEQISCQNYSDFSIAGLKAKKQNASESISSLFGGERKNNQRFVLCNPLLYGVRDHQCDFSKEESNSELLKKCLKDAKPYCVANSQDASQECEKQSSGKDDRNNEKMDIAAALIMAKPAAWDEYIADLKLLCDEDKLKYNTFTTYRNRSRDAEPETVKADVEKTCKVIKNRLGNLSKNYRGLKDKFKTEAKDTKSEAPAGKK